MTTKAPGEGESREQELQSALLEVDKITRNAIEGLHSGQAEAVMVIRGYSEFPSFAEYLASLEAYGQQLDPTKQGKQKAAIDSVLSQKDVFLRVDDLKK